MVRRRIAGGAGGWSKCGTVTAADKTTIDVIEDDSFLIEAGTTGAGVVSIFNAEYTKSGSRGGDLTHSGGPVFPRITLSYRSRHLICAMDGAGIRFGRYPA